MKTIRLTFYAIFIIFCLSTGLQGTGATFDIGTGLRKDKLNWNISGEPYGPNVLSELKWKNLTAWEVYAEAKIVLPLGLYARVKGDYGRILSGTNTDIDYLEDERKNPFSYSKSKADKGELFDLSLGVGIQLNFFQDILSVTPLLGCALNEQHLRMYHGKMEIDLFDPDDEGSPLRGLHNHYRARWFGPWIGLDFKLALTNSFDLFATYESHWVQFNGSGHWNLRTDFKDDFKHIGHGHGTLFSAGGKYNFCYGMTVGAFFQYQFLKIHNGRDRTYFHDSESSSKLNQVKWQSVSLIATLGLAF